MKNEERMVEQKRKELEAKITHERQKQVQRAERLEEEKEKLKKLQKKKKKNS